MNHSESCSLDFSDQLFQRTDNDDERNVSDVFARSKQHLQLILFLETF